MENDKEHKNKIDSAIDEIIYSKRLRQGFGFFFKTAIGFLTLAFVILVVLVATGIIS